MIGVGKGRTRRQNFIVSLVANAVESGQVGGWHNFPNCREFCFQILNSVSKFWILFPVKCWPSSARGREEASLERLVVFQSLQGSAVSVGAVDAEGGEELEHLLLHLGVVRVQSYEEEGKKKSIEVSGQSFIQSKKERFRSQKRHSTETKIFFRRRSIFLTQILFIKLREESWKGEKKILSDKKRSLFFLPKGRKKRYWKHDSFTEEAEEEEEVDSSSLLPPVSHEASLFLRHTGADTDYAPSEHDPTNWVSLFFFLRSWICAPKNFFKKNTIYL